MKTIRNLLTLAALFATAPIVPAAVPSTINYQGRLTNAAGVPQPGTRSMSLKIYDAATAGTQLYAETIGDVTVDANGVYGFQFGASGISAALATGAEHWLELTIDSVVQSPRQKLLAVPFSMKADQAAIATTVVNGAITAEKLSNTAVTDSLGNGGNIIVAKEVRNDLITQGFLEAGRTDASSVTFGKSILLDTSSETAVWTGTELLVYELTTCRRYNPNTDVWTNSTSAPSKRYNHTAVWTGNQMIIWGGTNNGNLRTGARYNPSTDTWSTTLATATAPSARTNHTAVWTGNEMIVWGGIGPGGTGGRYDPNTNTWLATSITNTPTDRIYHSAIWTGTEMIVWGGHDYNSVNLNTGARYNPTTDTWTSISNINSPSARKKHTAVWTGTVMIICGGEGGNLASSYYNPTTDTWTTMSTQNAVSGNGVWTGTELMAWQEIEGYGASYNLITNSWTRILFNSTRYDPIRGKIKPTWLGDRLMLYSQGNITFVKPAYLHLYAKP